ncbi:MAG: SRPBCC domain-containing protein [Paracoccaceae bacterium]|nr:SRPBCC domain-containing protein [Paracoccaceae bacterium]
MAEIRHKVGIAADPARVLRALTTVAEIGEWWSENATGDATEGGTFHFRGGSMTVTKASADGVLWRYSGPARDWEGTDVSIRLKPSDGQTIVLFTHSGWREPVEFMHHCSTKWAMFLMSLKSLIETGQGQPTPRHLRISWDD